MTQTIDDIEQRILAYPKAVIVRWFLDTYPFWPHMGSDLWRLDWLRHQMAADRAWAQYKELCEQRRAIDLVTAKRPEAARYFELSAQIERTEQRLDRETDRADAVWKAANPPRPAEGASS